MKEMNIETNRCFAKAGRADRTASAAPRRFTDEVPAPHILKESAQGISPVPIVDEMMNSSRRIFLTGPVTQESCASLLKQLMYLDSCGPVPITLIISSPGGDVDSGLAVYDTIRLLRSPVRTACAGMAASMGAILFLSGAERVMLPHSRLMIHDPAFGNPESAGTRPSEVRAALDSLLECQSTIVEIIADRTGLSKDEILAMTGKDTYLNTEKALSLHFATGIVKGPDNL